MINPNYNKRCNDGAYNYDKGYSDGFRDAVEELKQACQSCKSRPEEFNRPFTVPEIVRCKDCKHRPTYPEAYGAEIDGKWCYWCELHRSWKHDDWYCADGERRKVGEVNDRRKR